MNRLAFRPLSHRGFTIVELLVVIIVIGILVGLTAVSYGAVSRQATEASMKSDLEAARNDIALLKADKKNYPETTDAANDGEGLLVSGDNELRYGTGGSSYCVSVSNPDTPNQFMFDSSVGEIRDGSCGALVSTLAGATTYSDVHDGTGEDASFGWPTSLAFGPDGALYVGDCGQSVRRVTLEGVVTTVAGALPWGETGYVDGPAETARFTCIEAIAVASDGTIYVADNHMEGFVGIRKIAPDGTVSTLAGSTAGYADDTGTSAQFGYVGGIVIDDSGDLFVTDAGYIGGWPSGTYYGYIRKVTQAGVVTTIAGGPVAGHVDGTGSAARFFSPHGITMDSNGDLFVADSGNYVIRKVTQSGVVTTFAGSGVDGGSDGTGLSAEFGYPTGITIDDNDVMYVADNSPYKIRQVAPDAEVTTVVGGGSYCWFSSGVTCNGIGEYAGFSWIENGIAVDGNGDLYVADSDNYKIRRIQP